MSTKELSLEQKRAMLAALLKKKASHKSYPLSYAQQRMWFLDQLEPGNPAYNIISAARVRGPVDLPTLEKSVNEIVRRHAILRTTFSLEETLVQVAHPYEPFSLPVLQCGEHPQENGEAEMQRLAHAEAHHAFDLKQGPLVRVMVARFSDSLHALFVTMHHSISDGISMRLFMQELGQFYAAFSSNEPAQLPALSWQYVDFALWQQQQVQEGHLESQRSYWRTRLAGELPVLDLPTDQPRPAFRTSRGATHYTLLPPALVGALKGVCRQEGCTPYVFLLTAFQTLLHRYTGQEEIVIGTPVVGRSLPQVQEMIGLFINTLALRTSLAGTPAFRTLLARVQEETLAGLAHQEFPFELLVDDLQPVRDSSRSPIFQVAFIFQPGRPQSQQAGAVLLESLPTDTGAALLDLSLVSWESEEGVHLALEYNCDLFKAST
ncbi:MAG: hypothetical protein H0T73_15070, partial [Ardenticatenales bacterium]|nr:hypothetical protein [Ardenticatenales bacterium]